MNDEEKKGQKNKNDQPNAKTPLLSSASFSIQGTFSNTNRKTNPTFASFSRQKSKKTTVELDEDSFLSASFVNEIAEEKKKNASIKNGQTSSIPLSYAGISKKPAQNDENEEFQSLDDADRKETKIDMPLFDKDGIPIIYGNTEVLKKNEAKRRKLQPTEQIHQRLKKTRSSLGSAKWAHRFKMFFLFLIFLGAGYFAYWLYSLAIPFVHQLENGDQQFLDNWYKNPINATTNLTCDETNPSPPAGCDSYNYPVGVSIDCYNFLADLCEHCNIFDSGGGLGASDPAYLVPETCRDRSIIYVLVIIALALVFLCLGCVGFCLLLHFKKQQTRIIDDASLGLYVPEEQEEEYVEKQIESFELPRILKTVLRSLLHTDLIPIVLDYADENGYRLIQDCIRTEIPRLLLFNPPPTEKQVTASGQSLQQLFTLWSSTAPTEDEAAMYQEAVETSIETIEDYIFPEEFLSLTNQ